MINASDDDIIFYMSLIMTFVAFMVLAIFSLTNWNAWYGRYGQSVLGISIDSRTSWFLQEMPAFLVPLIMLFWSPQISIAPNVVLLCFFMVHYFQRTFVFATLIRGGKPMPLEMFFLAIFFCAWNGYLQALSLLRGTGYHSSWFYDPRFTIGSIIFFSGFFLNIHSDHVLRNLRKPGETGYKIPIGGLFNYVSGANYFAETLEWFGFAVACWNFSSLSFAIFTVCNIGPRAFAHHRWYKEKFSEDYPKKRKAFIPYIW